MPNKHRRCRHGKNRQICKHPDCIGKASKICSHGKQKARWKHPDCIGKATGLCKHGRRKAFCKHPDCIGKASGICPHGKQKARCPDCASLDNRLLRGTICAGCAMVSRVVRYKFALCRSCQHEAAGTETVEMRVLHILKQFFLGIQYSKSSYLAGKFCPIAGGCGSAYPDLYIALQDRVVFIEIDKQCHSQYDTSCEVARYDALQYGSDCTKPSLRIRFNPGSRMEWRLRTKVLVQAVRNCIHTPLLSDATPVMCVRYLFYNQAGKRHISAVRNQALTLTLEDDFFSVTDPDILRY